MKWGGAMSVVRRFGIVMGITAGAMPIVSCATSTVRAVRSGDIETLRLSDGFFFSLVSPAFQPVHFNHLSRVTSRTPVALDTSGTPCPSTVLYLIASDLSSSEYGLFGTRLLLRFKAYQVSLFSGESHHGDLLFPLYQGAVGRIVKRRG